VFGHIYKLFSHENILFINLLTYLLIYAVFNETVMALKQNKAKAEGKDRDYFDVITSAPCLNFRHLSR